MIQAEGVNSVSGAVVFVGVWVKVGLKVGVKEGAMVGVGLACFVAKGAFVEVTSGVCGAAGFLLA